MNLQKRILQGTHMSVFSQGAVLGLVTVMMSFPTITVVAGDFDETSTSAQSGNETKEGHSEEFRSFGMSLADTGLQLLNPVSNLFSIANKIEYRTFRGELPGSNDRTNSYYKFQPSFPFLLSNGKNIVLRATIGVNFGEPTYQTDKRQYASWLLRQRADTVARDGNFFNGHGFMDDIGFDVSYGGVNDDGFISMFGLAAVLPYSSDGSIERDQYLLGPEVAFGKFTSWGIIGAKLRHLTDIKSVPGEIAGEEIDYHTNMTSLKAFFAYELGNGWQIISNPRIDYDWEGTKGNKLALPIGGGIAKTTSLGRMPLNFAFEIQTYLATPDIFGPKWLLSLNITPVFSNRKRK